MTSYFSECEDETSQFYDFCEDIVITGTPDDMIFQGNKSYILVRNSLYACARDNPEL